VIILLSFCLGGCVIFCFYFVWGVAKGLDYFAFILPGRLRDYFAIIVPRRLRDYFAFFVWEVA
jgi:hypothetical protein